MKKALLAASIICSALILVSCGGSDDDKVSAPAAMRLDYSGAVKSIVGQDTVTASNNASISGTITNSAGKGMPAFVRVFNRVRSARHIDIVAQGFSDTSGSFRLKVPPGKYEVIVSRGPEYEHLDRIYVSVASGQEHKLNIALARIANLAPQGWFSGDLHMHTQHSDGINTPAEMVQASAAAGLHFIVASDHNELAQNDEYKRLAKSYDSDSGYGLLVIGGNEATNRVGHLNVWEPADSAGKPVVSPNLLDQSSTARMIATMPRHLAKLRSHSRYLQINHPFSGATWEQQGIGDLQDGTSFISSSLDWVAHAASILALVDTTEIWNSGNGLPRTLYTFDTAGNPDTQNPIEGTQQAMDAWYKLLNAGYRLASVGDSDCHDRFASRMIASYNALAAQVKAGTLRWPDTTGWSQQQIGASVRAHAARLKSVEAAVMLHHPDFVEYNLEHMGTTVGMPRTYAYTGGQFDKDALQAALKAGKSFITTGPLLFATVGSAAPGDSAEFSRKTPVSINVVSNKPVNRALIVADGVIKDEIRFADSHSFRQTVELDLSDSKWVIVYVQGADNYAQAYTNPVYRKS
ncbi:MAG: hypothetical protein H6R04_752 [Burkholderiaceae bacterium]|nr:hypothetical protein [Burkholderiaceae bacterium]